MRTWHGAKPFHMSPGEIMEDLGCTKHALSNSSQIITNNQIEKNLSNKTNLYRLKEQKA